jgi:hypothetical protein
LSSIESKSDLLDVWPVQRQAVRTSVFLQFEEAVHATTHKRAESSADRGKTRAIVELLLARSHIIFSQPLEAALVSDLTGQAP